MLLSADTETIDIEEIQDLVEIELMYYYAVYPKLAKSYILFREKRKQDREKANHYK